MINHALSYYFFVCISMKKLVTFFFTESPGTHMLVFSSDTFLVSIANEMQTKVWPEWDGAVPQREGRQPLWL